MKYRYITEYTACLNTTTPVLNYDLLSGNAMTNANFAIRIVIPNDMELDYEGDGISKTTDMRNLPELQGTPVVRMHGKWVSTGKVINELRKLPMHLWSHALRLHGYYPTKNGYLNETAYKAYLTSL